MVGGVGRADVEVSGMWLVPGGCEGGGDLVRWARADCATFFALFRLIFSDNHHHCIASPSPPNTHPPSITTFLQTLGRGGNNGGRGRGAPGGRGGGAGGGRGRGH